MQTSGLFFFPYENRPFTFRTSARKFAGIREKWGNKRGNKPRKSVNWRLLFPQNRSQANSGAGSGGSIPWCLFPHRWWSEPLNVKDSPMLTDAACRNATCPPDKKRERLTDSGGLYLEIAPTGSKRWFWKYRTAGKEGRLSLGAYPDVALMAARKARDAAKEQHQQGIDPVKARQVARAKASAPSAGTFRKVALEWLAMHRATWSESHHTRERRNLEKDLLPYLGALPIGEISAPELLAVVRKVEERGVMDVPRRVLQTAGGVWRYAVASGLAEHDVPRDLTSALRPHTKRNLPAITEPAELAELLRASAAYRGGPVVRAALRLAAILFQRPGNLRRMRWADLDLDRAQWSIPSADLKRRQFEKLNGRPHVVPLPRQALAIIRDLQPLTGRGVYVFPGLRNHAAPMSEAAVNAALHAMGYHGRHCWHGYRATGRTLLRQVLKYPADVIEAQLAHKGQITHGGAYDRATFTDERAAMLQTWADYLDKLAAGADVIPLRKRQA